MHSFTTERLLIRPLAQKDKEFYISLYSNAKIMRNIGTAFTNIEAEKAFERTIKAAHQIKPKVMTWSIITLESDEIIGIQGLTKETSDSINTNIGIILASKAHGKLFPEEAMGALMEYAFEYLSVNKINAFYEKKNLATKRFVKKLGFIYDIHQQPENKNHAYQYFDMQEWKKNLINTIL